MAFLRRTDLELAIQEVHLRTLSGNNEDLVTQALKTADKDIRGYLSDRYDVVKMFDIDALAENEDLRDSSLVNHGVSIALYHLSCRVAPEKVSQVRKDNYQSAIRWLELVAASKLNPELPLKPIKNGESLNPFQTSSELKQDFRY